MSKKLSDMFKEFESKKIDIQEEKKTPKIQKPITPKKEQPKSEEEVNWDNLNISQDELWVLFRLKFGKGTRTKRSELLPRFTEVFNRNLKEMRK